MLHRFLPLAALMYVSVSLPAHVEADTTGEFSFDHVPEGVCSVEVEEQGYLKAVQADVRVVLRRVAAVEFALVRGSDEVLDERRAVPLRNQTNFLTNGYRHP